MKAKMAKTRLAVGRRGKAGFTLIELLVVISIIAILTLIATANFTAVQQQARIGFAADTLVSTLREAQVLAKSGQRVGGTPATISGVRRESPVLQCRAV